ncbi:hypothetical protein SODALDRAFT_359858 [Sodiomyces alkalinus F11]|uniref:Uncharacterized protein n=1 Tax=Sodiomyces alkalinus (strain CBS 110278 / VKM F-3762 / F11) TaxID=1314773 RepID=A0A3N2PW71_SODAK|nr:hypothetical protein SODALDRAFT_359858 [Sodiomyces alkalinus F11]ROT38751.1 hypothetical protein SODALDRAFT_359858 [Sodiomyces alkalinus F11]
MASRSMNIKHHHSLFSSRTSAHFLQIILDGEPRTLNHGTDNATSGVASGHFRLRPSLRRQCQCACWALWAEDEVYAGPSTLYSVLRTQDNVEAPVVGHQDKVTPTAAEQTLPCNMQHYLTEQLITPPTPILAYFSTLPMQTRRHVFSATFFHLPPSLREQASRMNFACSIVPETAASDGLIQKPSSAPQAKRTTYNVQKKRS